MKLEKIKILSLKQSIACYTKKNTDVPAKQNKTKTKTLNKVITQEVRSF